MKRYTTTTDIGKDLDIDTDYGCSDMPTDIDEIINFLNEAKNQGATHVKLWGSAYNDEISDVYFTPVSVELESDVNYDRRVLEDKLQKESAKNREVLREKELLKKLKDKYEN